MNYCLFTVLLAIWFASVVHARERTTCSGGSGRKYCICPGNRHEVYFSISCNCWNEGWWWGKHRVCKPRYAPDCSRFSLCESCKNGLHESNTAACNSCQKPGYEGSRCNTDRNECATNKAGCEQTCLNTIGSYYCRSYPGFSLNTDHHGVTRRSCPIPEKPAGMSFQPIFDTGYREWDFESYVQYSCDEPHHVIIEPSRLRCGVKSDETMEWEGKTPGCAYTCGAEGDSECGTSGMDPLVCEQLGCCYNMETRSCHMQTGDIYIRYSEIRPNPAEGELMSSARDSDHCKAFCDNSTSCQSYAAHQTDSSFTCYTYDHDREYYGNAGEIQTDEDATYYDIVFFESDIRWQEERSMSLTALLLGCYDEETSHTFLPLVAISYGRLMTGMTCADTCHTLGYNLAGVQAEECRCGMEIPGPEELVLNEEYVTEFNITSNCSFNCNGDAGQYCGGENHYTVMNVPHDQRYLGCYDASLHYLPMRLWEANSGKSVEECIQACADRVFSYAGIENGGDCYCGKQHGTSATVSSSLCNDPCVSPGDRLWCGSEYYISIYRTNAAYDFSHPKVSHFTPSLYHNYDAQDVAESYGFTVFPFLRNFVTQRLVISAGEPFTTPEEQSLSDGVSDEIFRHCGDSDMTNQLLDDREIITLRVFHTKFSQIHAFTNNMTRKVTVYAQVVDVDVNIDINYTLIIRARKVVLDKEHAQIIKFSRSSPVIDDTDEEWQRLVKEGPYPDTFFQRISFTCARVLVDSQEQELINVGFAILQDIVSSPTKDQEQMALVRTAQALQAKLSGIDFVNTHQVPLYTQDHLVKILDTYHSQISVYKTDYDRVQDMATETEEFLELAGNLNSIHQETMVSEASVSLMKVKEAYTVDVNTQKSIEEKFRKASNDLDIVKDVAYQEIQDKKEAAERRAFSSFFGGIGKIILGAFTFDFFDVAGGLAQIGVASYRLDVTMKKLAKIVNQIEKVISYSDSVLSDDINDENLLSDVEAMVAMKVSIIEWQAIEDSSDIILNGLELDCGQDFRIAMSDYSEWGEAFSQAIVNRAETMRQISEKKAIFELRKLQQKRSADIIDDASQSVEDRHKIMHVMQEQMLDVSADLNDILVQFCQAYFYENLDECAEQYRPSFGGSMSSLLLKINAAMRDGLMNMDMTSSVSRSVTLSDSQINTTSSEHNNGTSLLACDQRSCPVTYLKTYGVLVVTVSPDNDAFSDLRKYRVKEIFIELEGLAIPNAAHEMKFYLSTTGLFHDRKGQVHDFLTRPVQLAFEKQLDEHGFLTIYADFPDEVHHITPFTTWVISVSHRSEDLDWTGVTALHMRFDGTAIVAHEEGRNLS